MAKLPWKPWQEVVKLREDLQRGELPLHLFAADLYEVMMQSGKEIPLIDRIHRLMHLWKQGDVHKVDEYVDACALRKNELFRRVVQSLIELSENSERLILESISNHLGARGARRETGPQLFGRMEADTEEEDVQ